MNKPYIIPWLLAAALALSACGAGASDDNSSWVESSASQPPAQSTATPLPTLSDVSIPAAADPTDTSAQEGDTSLQESSTSAQDGDTSGTADASQPGDTVQTPKAPPAVVSKPPKPKPEPESQTPDTSEETSASSSAPADEESPAAPAPTPTKADAQAYIGKSVSSLIAAIGQPSGRDYAPSCLGDGEDGELFYDGFTVYTYRVNGTETVQDVV